MVTPSDFYVISKIGFWAWKDIVVADNPDRTFIVPMFSSEPVSRFTSDCSRGSVLPPPK